VIDEGDGMALRAGFAAAALLGVVTTFGTGLWLAAVLVLFGLVVGLVAVEALPGMRRDGG
jgi:type IV secretory pathway TrbD component